MPSPPQPQPHVPDWEVFRGYISPPRLGPYLEAAGGNRKQAIQLYHWNIGLSGAVYESLHFFEVVLRNALDAQLSAWNATQSNPSGGTHDPDWLTDPSQLLFKLTQQGKDIRDATGRAQKATRTRAERMGHADILAQMSFGTWRFLLPDKNSRADVVVEGCLGSGLPSQLKTREGHNEGCRGDTPLT